MDPKYLQTEGTYQLIVSPEFSSMRRAAGGTMRYEKDVEKWMMGGGGTDN
jgi:hypothetical protein